MNRSAPRVVAFIPARMGASRFPGKPLTRILDLPLIEHVRRRVQCASVIDAVYVATCDAVIADAVCSYGGQAIMTAATHERCTERIEEAARQVDGEIAVIVQGDEPLFMPDVLSPLVQPLLDDPQCPCTNLLTPIETTEDLASSDVVKVLLDPAQRVLCYSRAPVPYQRVLGRVTPYRQTGVSAFRRRYLEQYVQLAPTPLEITESIDFMRLIEHHCMIRAVIGETPTVGVDRSDDVARVEHILREDPIQRALYQRIVRMG